MISVETPPRSDARTWSGPRPIAVWAGLIALSVAVGFGLRALGGLRIDHLPPLYANARLPAVGLLPAAALGLLLWWVFSRSAADTHARRLGSPLIGWALAAAWTVALAASDGVGALAAPLSLPTEYLAGLPPAGTDPAVWLRGFADALPGYPTHVKGHPPLPVLLLWVLRSAGLAGAGWAAAVIIAAGSSAVAAITITVRHLYGPQAARTALPYLVLAPYAVWVGTSMDALFLGVGAWGTALLAVACSTAVVRPAAALIAALSAFSAGVLLGALPYLSYGLLPLFAVPLAVLIVRSPGRTVIVALLAGLAVVPVAFTAAGFWWFDGVAATHAAWAAGAGAHRPYLYFLVGNLAVLGLLVGPATARALPDLARGRPRALAVAALAGIAALDLAGVTRGEVERIWLPYAAWVMTAVTVRRWTTGTGTGPDLHTGPGSGAGSGPGFGAGRGDKVLLLAQVATALVLQGFVRSPW